MAKMKTTTAAIEILEPVSYDPKDDLHRVRDDMHAKLAQARAVIRMIQADSTGEEFKSRHHDILDVLYLVEQIVAQTDDQVSGTIARVLKAI